MHLENSSSEKNRVKKSNPPTDEQRLRLRGVFTLFQSNFYMAKEKFYLPLAEDFSKGDYEALKTDNFQKFIQIRSKDIANKINTELFN